jgi:hypothetical protein
MYPKPQVIYEDTQLTDLCNDAEETEVALALLLHRVHTKVPYGSWSDVKNVGDVINLLDRHAPDYSEDE